jgi:hypothetical protein
MMHEDANGFKYFESLEAMKQDGYVPIKVFSVLQFFTLRGRTTNLTKDNLVPVECQYVVLGSDGRYYVRDYRGYTVDEMFFYRKDINFDNEEPVEILQRYVYDDKVWLLYSKQAVEETKTMLARVIKAHVSGTAELNYKTFIQLLEAKLKLEDYRDYAKNHTGFLTCCHLQEETINNLLKSTLKN